MNLRQFNRILLQTLLLPVISLALVAGLLAFQLLRAHRTVDAIHATDGIIADTSRVRNLIVDEETGVRGFQITADPVFLEPYNKAQEQLSLLFTDLRQELLAQGEDLSPLNQIVDSQQAWITTFAQPLILSVQAGEDTHDRALNLRGKASLDAIRASIAQLELRETALQRAESARWDKQYRRTLIALFVLVLAAGISISLFTVIRLHRVTSAYQGTLDGLRRHAQATFESEERLRTTLASIGDGVVVCDGAGNVELLNPVAETLLGVTQVEARGRPLQDVFHVIHENTREAFDSPVETILREQNIVRPTGHTVLLRPDGSEIFLTESGAPIHDRTGALTGVVMVLRDITNDRLTQNALLSAEKLATAGRLAASIAHEMHNPLDSVSNLLYLIRDETNAQAIENYLNLAQGELDRMGQVSRAMLGLYREAKAPVSVNVKEMVDSVLTLLDRQLKTAQVAVSSDIAEDLVVLGYPAELRQVLTNLLVNAADACTPVTGWIRVSAAPSRKPSISGQGSVLLEISDNGSGIDSAALEHIFEPFFTTKGERGTGLGLWVTRGIIDKHNGAIDVRSITAAADHGTLITLTLPRIRT